MLLRGAAVALPAWSRPLLAVVGQPREQKKKVMRALDIIGEMAGIDQQSLEEYSRLFSGSARLPDSQALALSALFGWAAPDEEELARVTGC